MFRRSFLTVILILCSIFFVQAKSQRTALNSIYAEGLGPGLLYSLNYERIFNNDLGVRLGISYTSVSASATNGVNDASASVTFMTFPLTVSYLGVSSGSHTLELGGGFSLISASGTASGSGVSVSGSGMAVIENILIGYRFQPVNGGFQFRVGFSGLLGNGVGASTGTTTTAFGFMPWFYLSLGGSF